MRFRATLELNGKTATGIEVPPDVVEALDGGKRPAVRVTIGDHAYRSTIGVAGGRTRLPVSAENRARAGIAARAAFDAVSFSGKRRYVDPIVQAKAPETRERRTAKAVADLD
ncbi:YdeI/OmpD-associated family protein [Luteimicrobium album]|nr:YdeI/OmpD-associated family protein [Luteimicrobium album]